MIFPWHTLPWGALLGGLLLGISVSVLLAVNGKIAGISGVLSGLFSPKSPQFMWRLIFALGMVLGGAFASHGVSDVVPKDLSMSVWELAIAGLLIGIGAKLANGCTSGHGICGMGRLSQRSIIATVTFMIVALVTVFVRLHML